MKSFLQSFALYLCSGMCRSYQFLAKVQATGKPFDSLPRNGAVAKLCSGKFNVASGCDLVQTLPPPYTVHFNSGRDNKHVCISTPPHMFTHFMCSLCKMGF
jgi:hypothetical protein